MSNEETRDEVYAIDEGNKELPRSERILQAFDEVLTSDEFCEKQNDFVDSHCGLFEEEGDMPPECMNVYKKYVELIENELLNKVTKIFSDFTFDELIPLIKNHKADDLSHADVFELLSATLDFTEFRDLMVSYNKGTSINLEAVITKV